MHDCTYKRFFLVYPEKVQEQNHEQQRCEEQAKDRHVLHKRRFINRKPFSTAQTSLLQGFAVFAVLTGFIACDMLEIHIRNHAAVVFKFFLFLFFR